MTPEQWKHVESLFDAALEQSYEVRGLWMEEACDDSEVRDEVDRMLAAINKSGYFLEEPARTAVADLLNEVPDQDERRLGPFRLVREIGRGGMSTVYLAERDDGQFDQTVAVKLLRPGFGSGEALRRFRVERQILASLQHPSIARLYGGGVATSESESNGEGVPYLVMEYVAGMPIDQYCDAEHLSIRDRLHLFMKVGEAVQFAHRNLVVHRDLKPSNILVKEEGRVKLLDFGIAKLLDAGMAPTEPSSTQSGARLMTLEYAAPEQVRGEPVTTATDVYQLGVVLYELLTGHRPYGPANRSTYEIERAVCEVEPEPPSTAVDRIRERRGSTGTLLSRSPEFVSQLRATDIGRLRRVLSGDLGAIVLKALRKEPESRYVSAQAFVDDIRLYLAGHPVSARDGSNAYRVRKFVARHRRGVAGAAVLLLVIIGVSTLAAWRITRSAERARLEALKSERTVDFLVSLFDQADPANWKLNQNIDAALLILGPAAERMEELREEPVVQAQLLHTLGMIYAKLGRPDRADTLLLRALGLRRADQEARPEDLASTLHAYGKLAAYRQTDEAVAFFREAAEIRRAVFKGDHPDLAWSLLHWARVLPHGHPQKADLRDEALHMFRRLYGPRSAQLAEAVHEYYVLGLGTQDDQELESAFRDVLAIEIEQFGEEDTRTAVTMHNLGLMLDGQGRHDEGMRLLQHSYHINRGVLGPDHPQVTTMAINVAGTLHEAQRYDEADPIFGEALEARRRTYPDSSAALAHSLIWYGRNLISLDRLNEAEAVLREAAAIEQRLYPGRAACQRAQGFLGRCLAAQRRFPEAEHLLKSRYLKCDSTWKPGHPARAQTLKDLTSLYEAQGRRSEAALYEAALAALEP